MLKQINLKHNPETGEWLVSSAEEHALMMKCFKRFKEEVLGHAPDPHFDHDMQAFVRVLS